jgi:hypothetical protein
MKKQDYTTTIMVNATAQQSSDAIKNVSGWWSENIEGSTDKLNEEFIYHYKDLHYCKLKLIELVPDQKVVWMVLDNYFKFTEEKSEWIGTKLIFEIAQKNNQTEIRFTHEGLVPQYECYEICREAWTNYIRESLLNLITTGNGQPNSEEEDDFEVALVEKWRLNQMKKQDYAASITVNATAKEAFKAINNVSKWWTQDLEGNSQKLNDVFTVHFGETFITVEIVELIPGKKIGWHVIDCYKHWLKDKKEWKDTKMTWEISSKKDATQITFTHIGLIPGLECYNGCENAWGQYINGSLFKLLTKEKRLPVLV